MADKVDRRVVEMKFDNAQFAKGVDQTMRDMDRLDKSMAKDTSSGKFDSVKAALLSVADGVNNVSGKFNAMGVVAASALNRITNDAITAGKNIAKALTVQPMIDGFKEYETQMGSIQTILANTQHEHTNLNDINKSLDELNTYADKTIYNFTEMTKNIGTFTAAGVKLKPATKAIQGIANLGAVSGSTSAQTSRVMYQLSQALAAGKVQLMDWNSVVNGGMGGKVFQDALVRTSEAYGTGAKNMIKAAGSFRDSLSTKEGPSWLTSKVLVDTLNQFAGVYSKAELIQKGFSESQAKEILKMGKTAEKAATEVKSFSALLDTTKEELGSGWTQSWEYIIGDFSQSKKLFTSMSNEINKFIQASANQRNRALQGWNQDKISKQQAHMFGDNDLKGMTGREIALKGLVNVYKSLSTVLVSVQRAFNNVFPPATAKTLTTLSAKFYTFTKNLKVGAKTAGDIQNVFQTFFNVIRSGLTVAKGFGKGIIAIFSGIWKAISGIFGPLLAGFAQATNKGQSMIGGAEELGSALEETGKKIGDFIAHLADGVPKAAAFAQAFRDAWSSIHDFFTGLIDGDDVLQSVGGAIDSVASAVRDKLAGLFGAGSGGPDFSGPITAIGDAIGNVIRGIGDALAHTDISTIFQAISAVFMGRQMLDLANTLKTIEEPFRDAKGFIGNIKSFMDTIKNSVVDTFKAMQESLRADTLIKIAGAIGIMALSLSMMSQIPSDSLLQSVGAIAAMAGILSAVTAGIVAMSNNMKMFGGIMRIAGPMILVAASVLILTSAMQKLASLDWDELQRGIIGLAAISSILTGVMVAMSKWGKGGIAAATSLVIFSMALMSVSSAVQKLGTMDVGTLIQGLAAVAVILGGLAAIVTKSNLSNATLMAGLGIMAMAEGIKILSDAVAALGNMDLESLLKGVGAASALLAVLTFMASQDLSAKMILVGAGLVLVAQAMSGIVNVVQSFGGTDISTLAQGLIAIAAALGILAGGLALMSGSLAGAASLLIAAAAINVLVPAIQALGSLSLDQVVIAMIALAGAFAVLGGAAVILSPVLPAIIGLSGALLMMGAGFALAGAGVAAFAAGLLTLSLLLQLIANSIGPIISTIVSAIVEFTSQLATHATEISGNILTIIGEFISQFVKAVEENLPKIISTAGKIITEFIVGLFEAITTNAPKIIKAAADMIIAFVKGIGSNMLRIIKAAYETIIKFINGLADAVNKYQPQLNRALKRLIDAVLNGLKDFVKVMLGKGNDGILGFIKGLGKNLANVGEKAGKIKDQVVDAVKGAGTWLYDTGKNIIDGLTNGIEDFIGNVKESAEHIAKKVQDGVADFLGIHSPSRVMYRFGRYVVIGFANGMRNNEKYAVKSVNSFARAIKTAYGNGPITVESKVDTVIGGLNTTPVIRPVMDMDALKGEVARANRLLASNASYNTNFGLLGSGIASGLKMGSGSVVNSNKISLSVSVPVSQVGQSIDTNRLANDVASSIADALNKRLATQGR